MRDYWPLVITDIALHFKLNLWRYYKIILPQGGALIFSENDLQQFCFIQECCYNPEEKSLIFLIKMAEMTTSQVFLLILEDSGYNYSDPQKSLSGPPLSVQAGAGSSQDIWQGAPFGPAGCIKITQIQT